MLTNRAETARRAPARGVLAFLACAVLGLSACSSSSTPASTSTSTSTANAAKPTLNVGIIEAPLSLDPSSGAAGPYTPMLTLEYEPLITLSPSGQLVPGLATSWHYVGSGNTNFELTLRQDARFADGTPVNAAAVKSWFEYNAKSPGEVAVLGVLKSVSTVGNWTVDMQLSTPNPQIPLILAANWGMIGSPAGVAKPSLLAGGEAGGAGPYQVVPAESVIGTQYTYVPNKYYYDQSMIRYGKIVVKIITSASSLLEAAETGEVDAAYGSTLTAAAAAQAGLTVYSAQSGVNQLIFTDLNGTVVKALGNASVRQALNMAVDRAAIVQGIVGKYGSPTSEPELGPGYLPGLDNYYSYNPGKAKAMLAAAGYPNGFTMSVVSWVDPSVGGTILEAVAHYLAAVGVTLKVYQPPTGADFVSATASKGTYTGAQILTNIGGTGSSAIEDYQDWESPTSILNVYKSTDPMLASLYAQALSASNPLPVEQSMIQREVTQAETLPIYKYEFLWYVGKHVGGFQMSNGNPQPDIAAWYPA
jgi:peptide/nickel transport system substrate-binding protein